MVALKQLNKTLAVTLRKTIFILSQIAPWNSVQLRKQNGPLNVEHVTLLKHNQSNVMIPQFNTFNQSSAGFHLCRFMKTVV